MNNTGNTMQRLPLVVEIPNPPTASQAFQAFKDRPFSFFLASLGEALGGRGEFGRRGPVLSCEGDGGPARGAHGRVTDHG
jgi:hypothetical protein